MKTRSGFVSNSSSSSFIVGFKKDSMPKDTEELRKILFGDQESLGDISAQCAAECIFEDMNEDSSNLEAIKVAIMGGGSMDGDPGYPSGTWNMNEEERQKAYKDYSERFNAARTQVLKGILEKAERENLNLFVFDYGNDIGRLEAYLEDIDLFANAPMAIQISNH